MFRVAVFFLIALCLALSAPSVFAGVPVPVDPILVRLLNSHLNTYSDFWQAQNFTGIVEELYAPDCQFMPTGANITIEYGHNQTLDFIQFLSNGVASLNFTTLETGADNSNPNLIYQIGLYDMFTNTGATRDQGKHVLLWEKQDDGTWKIYVHIFNSSIMW